MFFERFKELCTQNNTTPTAIIIKLGMNRGNVTHWKNGIIPNSKIISQIADCLDTSADYLLCKTDDPAPPGNKNNIPPEKLLLLDRIGYAYYGRDDEELDEEDVDDIIRIVEMTRKAREKRNKDEK